MEMVGTKDARVTKKQLHYTEYTPVTNSQVEAEIFPDVPTRCSDMRTLRRSLLYIQEVLGIDHSKMLFNKGNKIMMYDNLVKIKLGTLLYIQEVLGIDHSKMLFNKGNKMMYYSLAKIKLAMFNMDIVMDLFNKNNIGMTACPKMAEKCAT